MKIATVLRQSQLPLLELRMLLEHLLQVDRAWLIAHDDYILSPQQLQQLNHWIHQRQQGMPMAYLVGQREFMGLSLTVTPAVLIPRPDTELLVETVLQQAPQHARVIDLGTGSGAIAISLKYHRPDLHVTATDQSAQALAVAQANAQHHQVQLEWIQSDWWQSIPPRAYDVIISNPPYIAHDDEHLQQGDLRFEPVAALTDFANGMTAIENIIQSAPRYLVSGGSIWLEHGYQQALAVQQCLAKYHFQQIRTYRDLAQNERVTGAYWYNDNLFEWSK